MRLSRWRLGAPLVVAAYVVPLATAGRGAPATDPPPTIGAIERNLANALAKSPRTTILHVHKQRTKPTRYATAVEWADLADGRQRMLGYDAAGRLVTETVRSPAMATGATMRTLTFEYPSKRWPMRTASLECPTRGCPLPPNPSSACGCDLDPFTNFPTPPNVSLLGQGNIRGRTAFHLRFVTNAPLPSTTDMWIDRSTHLPLYEKVAFRETLGNRLHARPVGPTITVTNDFTWLPRTQANLAHFGVVIPPGFKPAGPA